MAERLIEVRLELEAESEPNGGAVCDAHSNTEAWRVVLEEPIE